MDNTCVCCGAVVPEGRQVCPGCEHKYDPDEFFGRKRMRTNYDRVRRMSAEDMAKFLNRVEHDGRVVGPRGKNTWLRWLKEEVK